MLFRRSECAHGSAILSEIIKQIQEALRSPIPVSKRTSFAMKIFAVMLSMTPAFGQTTINLATQSRNADFSAFAFTRPVSVGTSLPSTCLVGQLFFDSAAASGSDLFSCVSQNLWGVIGGGSSSYNFTAPLSVQGNTVSISQATSTTDGYLSQSDWNTFFGKQPAGNYITALTGDLTAVGPGSAAATLATVNTSPGQCGDATHVCQITTNGKGLVTAQTAITLSGGGGSANGNATSIQGVGVSSAAPSNLQVLQFQSSSNSYVPTTLTGGSGGNCAQVASQLNDFVPTYSSNSSGTVTINPTASSSTPTIVENGNAFYRGTTPASFFAAGGTNTELAYIYVDLAGNLDVGTPTTTISCTGCTYVAGVSAFPAGSKALFTWPISSGTLATSGATDWRAFLSAPFSGGSVTSIQLAPSGIQPACSSSIRGTFWFQNNGSSQDHVQVCVYSGTAYSWYSIY